MCIRCFYSEIYFKEPTIVGTWKIRFFLVEFVKLSSPLVAFGLSPGLNCGEYMSFPSFASQNKTLSIETSNNILPAPLDESNGTTKTYASVSASLFAIAGNWNVSGLPSTKAPAVDCRIDPAW